MRLNLQCHLLQQKYEKLYFGMNENIRFSPNAL